MDINVSQKINVLIADIHHGIVRVSMLLRNIRNLFDVFVDTPHVAYVSLNQKANA
ncbi:MAG: hypothetical protein MJ174_08630 [Treponema sp.]|nr:hypothetical protein [Treponema sp.]